MKELDPSLYKNKVENPQETIYEVITAENGLGWGMVIADFGESEPHFHHHTSEAYVVLEGELEVILKEKESHFLKTGDFIFIESGQIHQARAIGDKPARIAAFTFPAWSPEDHYLADFY
jgi:mannose-6-phosphate isomerase-like protein (cupin superfamily)